MTPSPREQALIEALREATEGVDAALATVEQGNYIPNWDWLRVVRARARDALAAYFSPRQAPPPGDVEQQLRLIEKYIGDDDGPPFVGVDQATSAIKAIRTAIAAPPPGDVGELVTITVGDLRRARAALGEGEGGAQA